MDSVIIDDAEYVDKRIDIVLSSILDIPRNRIQNYIKSGYITVNSKEIKKNYKLELNDKVSLAIPEEQEMSIEPKKADIKIVYEDDDLVVVDKPSGLVVHPGAAKEDTTVLSALMYLGVKLSIVGAPLRGGVVHRIDKNTSGILVLAKSDKAHFLLAKQFFSHTIDRKYIGIVCGHLREKVGVVDAPIARHPIKRKEFCVRNGGKNAKTEYKVLKSLNGMDVVMFKLFTGRTHQIRVHMKHLNHPLVGDEVYGKKSNIIKRHALHAFFLKFIHPSTGKEMSFFSRLPNDMLKIIKSGG